MEFTTIQFEKSDLIATITLNRPDNMNAFNIVMLRELIAAFETVALDDEIRVVILTGQGRAFCAGADVKGVDDAGIFYTRTDGADYYWNCFAVRINPAAGGIDRHCHNAGQKT